MSFNRGNPAPAHTRVMAQTEVGKDAIGLRSWFSALAELWLLLELESIRFLSSVSVLLLPYLRTYLRTNLPAKYTNLRCTPKPHASTLFPELARQEYAFH